MQGDGQTDARRAIHFRGEEQPETISLSQAFIAHVRDSQLMPDFNRDIRHPTAKSEKNERHFGFEWRSSMITARDRSTKRRRNNPAQS
jgi:hypothetical protein